MDIAVKLEPDAAGMREDRLERLTEHFGAHYVDTGKIAGCQITVVRGGHVAYQRSLGLMDRERAVPGDGEDVIRRERPVDGHGRRARGGRRAHAARSTSP